MKLLASYLKDAFCKRNIRCLAITIALGAAICCTDALAQSGAGGIQGTIQDSTGAVIPGALVHIVNQKTGQSINTKSNGVGFYSVPSLFTGTYTLTISFPEMKTYETTVYLQAAQTAVIDPSLSSGSVTQKVVVSGNAVQLTTYNSPTISSVLENSRINQLPMNGRNLLTLAGLTTPGLEDGGLRANGNEPAALEYVQDGAPLSDRFDGGATRLPDPDAVQEVRLETANSSAQFATPATGIITTKSGTNELHGSLFETARNNYIGIAKARQDPSNLIAPHLVRNEFGGSLGGPIVIPKLYNGKNKTFFFFAYERYSLRSSVSQLDYVPTVAMRNGDFSGLVNSQGVLQQLYDSSTTNPVTFQRQPFSNNQIPASRESPLAKTLNAITPLPTNNNNPEITSNHTSAAVSNDTAPTVTFRLDQNFNENNRAYLRFTSDNYSAVGLRNYPSADPATIAGDGIAAGASNLMLSPTTVFSFALGYTHIFSPTFFSETVLSNEWERDAFEGGGDPSLNYGDILGLPNNLGKSGFPLIGGSSLFMNFAGSQFAYEGSQIITNLDENLTKIIGKHQLSFGGRYRHERLGVLPAEQANTTYFGEEGTGEIDPTTGLSYGQLPNTGNYNADFFIGAASSYTVARSVQYQHYRDQEFDTYFQDNYHPTSRLTINFGIRWEILPSPTEANNSLVGFDFTNKAIVLGQPISKLIARGATTQAIITNLENLGTDFETPQEAGLPNSMIFNSNFTFSPRLGFAYAPFGAGRRTVLRAGYGRYIYPIQSRNTYENEQTNPPYYASYSQNYTSGAYSPDGENNYLLRSPQTVVAGLNSADVVDTGSVTSILPGIGLTVLNPHFPPTYVTQANVTLEQPLKWASVLRLTYLYNHGTNLDQLDYLNTSPSPYVYETTTGQLPPTGYYSSVALGPYDQTLYSSTLHEDDRNGISNDNSFQLNFQHLYRNGYAYQVFYVFSRAFRMGGNGFRDSILYPIADYAPGLAPVSTENVLPWMTPKALNRFQNYIIDDAIPEHHIGMNGLVDLPVGRGKRFFGHSNRFVNEVIGGFQIAGDANILSEQFQPSAGNWGPTNALHIYKHAHKVNDCRSGVCYSAYQWFNGYLSPLVINSANGVSGVPTNYLPYQTPINNIPGAANFGTNNVPITLANGKTITTAYSPGPGLNPFSKTFLNGPFNYTVDLSLFKVFPITERVNLRVNVDAFNALNIQGFNNPDSTTGIESLRSSHNTPRQLQFTARLTF
jgi:hypothetical protein